MSGPAKRKTTPPRQPPPPRAAWFSRQRLLGAFVVLFATVMLVLGMRHPVDDNNRTALQQAKTVRAKLQTARAHLTASRWKQAGEAAAEILATDPAHAAACLIAGEAASRQERFQEALEHYAKISPSRGEEFLSATVASAEIHRLAGSLDRAETLYRGALNVQPEHILVFDRLAVLLKLTGRHEEAKPFLLRLVARGACGVQHLQFLADPLRPLQSSEYLERSLHSVPEQVFPWLGIAAIQLSRGESNQAEQVLVKLRRERPQHPEIEAAYGRCLWELRDLKGLDQWQAEFSDSTLEHPDVWYVTGLLYEARERSKEAGGCFLECLRRDPDHREALHRAGRVLQKLGHSDDAGLLLKRSQLLNDLAAMAGRISMDSPDAEVCRRMVELLELLERDWEAFAWTAVAGRQSSEPEWVQSAVQRLEPKLRISDPFRRREAHPGFAALLGRFPVPERRPSNRTETASEAKIAARSAEISFVDETLQAGIDFTYFEDPDPETEGRRMHEFTGGGVAVLDFDLDGWPDLYFTQGSELTKKTPSKIHLDQLFRNLGTGRFLNVTANAGLIESDFSQGVSAGDFNNDGFPDLYVASFGENHLFENKGDGTYSAVSRESLPSSRQWTTSCAIADLNLDGIPDLYDVNYVDGPDVLERRCRTPVGMRVCVPSAFEAAPDRLCLGNGDGTFRDVSQTSGIGLSGGKGLGLLIGNLSDGSPVDVFVANDTDANFLFSLQSSRGLVPAFTESAITAGLAFSYEGRAQACMGVAAADFDNNGQLDLFVTNYFNESNALYLSRTSGFFEDECRAAGLHLPSLAMLGFGTQAMDVDLDGWVDLVVANGDLDDFSHESRSFQMRPQLFLNRGQARFEEWSRGEQADYFSNGSAYRGRGLARLDWNRDGLPDFVVSNLDEPSRLITNRTTTRNHFLVLKFVGRESSRDAIGVQVRIHAQSESEPPHCAWLTAGDGYQASNERRLFIGLGNEPRQLVLEVLWPSGNRAIYTSVVPDQVWICIEGRASLVKLEAGMADAKVVTD